MVLGPDQIDQQTGVGIKEAKAKRVSDYLSYELLVESDSWLTDEHKNCHILAAWGVSFKEVYYDPITKQNCSELIPPTDIVINKNTFSLDKAKRITIRLYMTKNEILEKMNSNQFLPVDFEKLKSQSMDNAKKENDSQEENPVYEILKQYCYYDLDNDGYRQCTIN
jgi:hypothetical protein